MEKKDGINCPQLLELLLFQGPFLILPLQPASAAFLPPFIGAEERVNFEFKAFLVESLMASSIVHSWTLLFLSFAQAVCFDKKSEILWSCSSVV
jgi:hypothetical protein